MSLDFSSWTTENLVALGSGQDMWHTKAIGDMPALWMSDGPNGLRREKEGGGAVSATCFPPAVGLGQSWDRELISKVAAAIARECRAAGVNVILGPGINLKRSILGGRNFEYVSEDPHLSGAYGVAWVNGAQAEGVAASLKHFALNNQETDRMRVSVDIEERPLREIYLRNFQRVVQDAKPWTVMCAYNRVNGVAASNNKFLLTDILRTEWGFDGVVVSDWGAVSDRPSAVIAGLDLEMPGGSHRSDEKALEAVHDGIISRENLVSSAERMRVLVQRTTGLPHIEIDTKEHHDIAREAARGSISLLQNRQGVLPLAAAEKLLVLGDFALRPRFRGSGSSFIEPTHLDIPLNELSEIAEPGCVRFIAHASDLRTEDILHAATNVDVVILFPGVPQELESEGFDRSDWTLPKTDIELLRSVSGLGVKVVTVLSHGGVVDLNEVVELSDSVLDGGLLGQGGGRALAEVIYGIHNPSGRITETIPKRIEDSPAFLDFPGEKRHVLYSEGIFVGYRGYDARAIDVLFPFGHGLSYTTFEYSAPEIFIKENTAFCKVTIKNIGHRPGREIVQLYLEKSDSSWIRAPRVLAGFDSVDLDPGASSDVVIPLDQRDAEIWNVDEKRFVLESGRYVAHFGASSRDLRASADFELVGNEDVPILQWDSTLGEAMAHPYAAPLLAPILDPIRAKDIGIGVSLVELFSGMPLNRIGIFIATDDDRIASIIAEANASRNKHL